MNILIVEPFFGGSHAQWAKGVQQYSQHRVKLLTLPARHWKWRMYGAAVTLAQQYQKLNHNPDLIIATDMLDVCTFVALIGQQAICPPIVLYFHENQITYPWSPDDPDVGLQRDNQYGYINYTSSLVAKSVLFNSHFHQQSFLKALPTFLKQFPDYQNHETIVQIHQKTQVLPLALDLTALENTETVRSEGVAVLLWNHRWEYDKNPNTFFETLFQLKSENIPFKVIILGKSYRNSPSIFAIAKQHLKDEILHFGYTNTREGYAYWLHKADILPVTSHQDFFGGSVVEAMYCGCFPLLPKRLAYPEHIPLEEQDAFFFESKESLYVKLKSAILNINYVRQNTRKYKSFVEHYDWKNSIRHYDTTWNNLL